MAVGQSRQYTEIYSATIVTSDPTTGTIQAVTPGGLVPVVVVSTPVAFRWPKEGETWRIKKVNNVWYLDEPYPLRHAASTTATSTTANKTINTINPGDTVINSPTGTLHVLGSGDGTSDFTMTATSSGVPSGVIHTFAGSAAPIGYLLCDGSQYDPTTHPTLHATIGNTYNTGGETVGWFRVPDLQSRSAVGVGTGAGLSARTLGSTGGEEVHQLSDSELASHSHGGATAGGSASLIDPGHAHSAWQVTGGAGAYNIPSGAGNQSQYLATSSSGTGMYDSGHAHGINADGGNVAHNNMHPFLALNYIIKI